MKKNIFYLTFTSLAILSLSSCSQEHILPVDEGSGGLKITLTCSTETKATQDGVGNENLIKTVDVFLFGSESKYTYRFHEEPSASTNYTMYIGSSFANEASYTVYAIVNYPYTDLDDRFGTNNDASSKKTLEELKAMILSESECHTFTAGAAAPYDPASEKDLALVMTGQVDGVTISQSTGSNILGTANISLSRLAAKVTMDFYLQDELVNDVYGNGTVIETWTPSDDPSAIRAYLCNGNQSIALSGDALSVTSAASLFDYKPNTGMTPITGKSGFSTAYSIPAFYTYPESWTQGEANEPYIKLIVQWNLSRTTASGTTTSQKETYYKVMLPSALTELSRNTWYNFQLDVTQLGSTSDTDAVPVIPSYQVADWTEENIVLSTLVQSYYLSVSETNKNLAMYTDKLEIPFTSSGDVSAFGSGSTVTVTYTDYSTNPPTQETVAAAEALAMVSIDNENSILTINRPIADNFPDDYDVSRYIFDITLHLIGADNRYDETLTVTQYPLLFITAQDTKYGITDTDRNTKPTVLINSTAPNTTGTTSKDVWDNTGNNTKDADNHTHYLGTIPVPTAVLGATSNNNPNLYTVSATHINLKVSYDNNIFDAVIGDPRGAATNDYSEDEEVLYGDNDSDKLYTYRPTDSDTKNVIAPVFMCASSYGKTMAVSYEGAIKRCAAYQEYGYPAGRWRLPTIAEVAFLQELNADSKIPSMFAASEDTQILGYWTAGKELYTTDGFIDLSSGATLEFSGSYQYNKTGGTKPYRGFVRCVYDIWYWGDKKSALTNSTWLGYKPNLSDTF